MEMKIANTINGSISGTLASGFYDLLGNPLNNPLLIHQQIRSFEMILH